MPRRRSWLKLTERMAVRSATRHTGSRVTCAQVLGCCATIGLFGGVASYSVRSHSTASSGSSSRLAKLLPKDLDGLASRTTLRALGVQLLLFGGFKPTTTGWQRRENPNPNPNPNPDPDPSPSPSPSPSPDPDPNPNPNPTLPLLLIPTRTLTHPNPNQVLQEEWRVGPCACLSSWCCWSAGVKPSGRQF